ncbi:extracellular conserved serine-rich protein [Thermoascus aurantiacus ATCC 26904]
MRFTLAASIIALAASVAAVQVTSPTKGAELDLTKPNTIKWTSVNTDPDKFNIYLVKNSYPQTKTLIASDVDKSKGSYTFDSLKGVTTGDDYQINLESDEPQNTGILAQSEQFSVTKAVAGTTATATTTSGTTTSSHTTLTTISGTASASSTGNAASSSANASSSSTASPTPSTGAAATLPVSAGAGTFLMALFALFL